MVLPQMRPFAGIKPKDMFKTSSSATYKYQPSTINATGDRVPAGVKRKYGTFILICTVIAASTIFFSEENEYYIINGERVTIDNGWQRWKGKSFFLRRASSSSSFFDSGNGMMRRVLTTLISDEGTSMEDDCIRETAAEAMTRTPGWNSVQPDAPEDKVEYSIDDLYVYAPHRKWELLDDKYSLEPMPQPYQSIMTPSNLASLGLSNKNSVPRYNQPYTAEQVIKTLPHIEHVGFILRYSGESDRFSTYISQRERWSRSNRAHANAFISVLVRILRQEYPDRFRKGRPDFSVVLSAGDSLKMHCNCLGTPQDRESPPPLSENDILERLKNDGSSNVCNRFELSPIWQFGSGFVHPETVPTMVTMPIWPHMACFETFRFDRRVCDRFVERTDRNWRGVFFGTHFVDVEVDAPKQEFRGEDTNAVAVNEGHSLEQNPHESPVELLGYTPGKLPQEPVGGHLLEHPLGDNHMKERVLGEHSLKGYLVGEPSPEGPLLEKPPLEEPLVENPPLEEPLLEESLLEEPSLEEPSLEEPSLEEPSLEEPSLEEPSLEEPSLEEPLLEEPLLEEPSQEEPSLEEPPLEEPSLDKSSLDESSLDESSLEELSPQETSSEEHPSEEQTLEEISGEPLKQALEPQLEESAEIRLDEQGHQEEEKFKLPEQEQVLLQMTVRRRLQEGSLEMRHQEGEQDLEKDPLSDRAQGSPEKEIVQVPVYENLMPQIIWRGTDFSFLNCLDGGAYHWYILPQGIPGQKTPEGFDEGLYRLWHSLGPRWKAAAMSFRSELEAKAFNKGKQDVAPWIDFKFTPKGRPGEAEKWDRFIEQGGNFVTFERMNSEEASGYKYHIDFGGGGGTTWTGTYEKLALPGVLFHHETPTYDWFHEDLFPWVHYIPVKTDLSDLRDRYEWAESHPEDAMAISEAGTTFMKYMGTMEYWERVYDRIFIKRLGPIIEAYQPVEAASTLEDNGTRDESDDENKEEDEEHTTAENEGDTKDSDGIESYDDEDAFLKLADDLGLPLRLVGTCDGFMQHSCEWLVIEQY